MEDNVDQYVQRYEYRIGSYVRAALAERKLTFREVAVMAEEKFVELDNYLFEKRVPVHELKSLYAFRSECPGASDTKGEMQMQYGDMPTGKRPLESRVITTLGELPVLDGGGRENTNVLFDGREVVIPREMIQNSATGEWGSVYALSCAAYADNNVTIGRDEQERLRKIIQDAYEADKSYVQFE